MKLEIRDGRIVIHRIKKQDSYECDSKSLVHLTPTNNYKISKLKAQIKALEESDTTDDAITEKTVPILVLSELNNNSKKHKKDKRKKNRKKYEKYKTHKKKHRKKKAEMDEFLSENLQDRAPRTSNLLSELLKYSEEIIVSNGVPWIYNRNDGCFRPCNAQDAACELKGLLSEEQRMKVSSGEYKEAYEQLRISKELRNDERFFANGPFVNCQNGIVDVCNGSLQEHTPKLLFKHCLKAKFDVNAECPEFKKYIGVITDGDLALQTLIQTMLGYLFSHYNNAKTAFLIYGVPHTGKSTLCKIIEAIVGEDYTSHIDLSCLNKQGYAASIRDKVVNIAPDLTNGTIKEIGFFKSLTSHNDTITATKSSGNPIEVKGETKMVFSSNHLLSFDGKICTEDLEAVFNRLIYIPYMNKPIEAEADIKDAANIILETERDGIFTWAMEGLQKYLDGGEIFPDCKLSSGLKSNNMVCYCPEKAFVSAAIKRVDGVYASTQKVKQAFDEFCSKYEVSRRPNLQSYLMNVEGIAKVKKRIDECGKPISIGNPISVYEGIRLRKKYE